MKLSTRARYGLKAMVDLAVDYGKGPVSTASLAKRQGNSEAYLEQIMGMLRRAGLVSSLRGASGGSVLAREPAKISVAEILLALEGDTCLVNCVGKGASLCERQSCCSTRSLWQKLQNRIDEVLEQTSLEDMAEDYKKQMEIQKDETGLS